MKKNGFTLIELIGTMVILSLILLIITPAITNSLKKGINNADDQVKESIIAAARNYVSDHKNTTCVNLSTLQNDGYLDENIKSPKDETPIVNKKIVVTKYNTSGKTKYTYSYEDGSC